MNKEIEKIKEKIKALRKRLNELEARRTEKEWPQKGNLIAIIHGDGDLHTNSYEPTSNHQTKAAKFGNVWHPDKAAKQLIRQNIFNLLWQQADGGDYGLYTNLTGVFSRLSSSNIWPRYSSQDKAEAALDSIQHLIKRL